MLKEWKIVLNHVMLLYLKGSRYNEQKKGEKVTQIYL